MPGLEKNPQTFRFRVKNPKQYDKRSFRTKAITNCVSIVTGCQKGHWHPKNRKGNQCDVGLQTQTYIFNRRCYNRDDVKDWIKRNITKKGKKRKK